MSFPRYEKYKESGVEWLGEVPEHWSIRRMKTLFEIKKRIAGEIGYDILSITQNGIKVKDTESNEGQVAMDYAKYQFVYPGDFAMNHMDLLTGYVDISKVEGVTSPDYRVFSIRKMTDCHPSYFLRLFQSAYHQKIFYAFGQGASQFGRWRLPTEAFNDFAVPYPPLSEQVLIGDFLDRETAKIDSLIEEQRRLIELLKEKRQAVISHAVDKGLHPNTQRKSWKLKHLIKSIEQGWSPQCDNTTAEDGEWAVLKVGSVNYGIFNPKENKALPPDIEPIPSLGITKDDVLISRANTRELVGSAAVAEHDYPRHLLCDKIYRLKVRSNLCLAQYIGKFLGTPAVRSFIEATATGASQSMVNIGQDVIRELPISLPALSEQRAIIGYLKTQEEVFANLTGEATRAVALLQERRSALISAAVTGKIDVRNYIPKEAA